ncbi:hypothetical protein A0J61_04050 [Choanephora cucurbitarum]|uniref:Uncharacterized protein n=1 Tax=Choanephora cucurbitarum TaxID=101091 RepID=A0A1C7NFL3_9FUNG|nr:hypothetical protein A0J61_04050 [Choanephora cucurbitarum]
MHSISDCPLRSMAIVRVNRKNVITFASKEMMRLLVCEQLVHQNLSNIWIIQQEQEQQQSLVTLIKDSRTLCICTHEDGDAKVIVCTDISELDQLYQQQDIDRLTISRLTMYGTIDALFQPCYQQNDSFHMNIGQPMMRYIHSDDVQMFCAGLNEATKSSTLSTFHVRLLAESETEGRWTEFKVMSIEGGNRILCLMTPYLESKSEEDNTNQLVIQTTHYYIEKMVTRLQQKFWHALEQGITLAARNLAGILIFAVQTLWSLWHDDTKFSLALLVSNSSEYMFRRAIEATKERPEINCLYRMISWVGISPTTSKAFIDDALDQTTEWLISKTTIQHQTVYCDILV